MGKQLRFQGMERFWDWTDKMATQHSECFKMANFTLREFHFKNYFEQRGTGAGRRSSLQLHVRSTTSQFQEKCTWKLRMWQVLPLIRPCLLNSLGRQLVHQRAPQCENHTSAQVFTVRRPHVITYCQCTFESSSSSVQRGFQVQNFRWTLSCKTKYSTRV